MRGWQYAATLTCPIANQIVQQCRSNMLHVLCCSTVFTATRCLVLLFIARHCGWYSRVHIFILFRTNRCEVEDISWWWLYWKQRPESVRFINIPHLFIYISSKSFNTKMIRMPSNVTFSSHAFLPSNSLNTFATTYMCLYFHAHRTHAHSQISLSRSGRDCVRYSFSKPSDCIFCPCPSARMAMRWWCVSLPHGCVGVCVRVNIIPCFDSNMNDCVYKSV